MAEPGTQVTVVQEQEKSRVQKLKEFIGIGKTPSAIRDSERFERLGLLPYPRDQQLDFRMQVKQKAQNVVNGIYAEIYQKKIALLVNLDNTMNQEERKKILEELEKLRTVDTPNAQKKAIQILSDAFEVAGLPWYKGLDKPRLQKKYLAYRKVVSCYGNIPSIYKVLDYGTHTLQGQSYASEEVAPQTPVLMETKPVTHIYENVGATPLNPRPTHIGTKSE